MDALLFIIVVLHASSFHEIDGLKRESVRLVGIYLSHLRQLLRAQQQDKTKRN